MLKPPLNAINRFELWPSFSPGEWLDFNPTVITLQSGARLALIRRDRIPPIPGEGSIWTVPVNEELHPIGVPTMLVARGEDPRAVVLNNRIFLFYVVIQKESSGKPSGSCVMLAECSADKLPLTVVRTFQLPKNPTGRTELQNVTWEKNWVPFATGIDQVGLIYAHQPWTILLLNVASSQEAPNFITAYTDNQLTWPYGEIRGGTTPVEFDERHFVTFFHSAQVIGSRNVYMVGACVFDNVAPYSPRLITNEPLLIAPYRSTAIRFGWPVLASVIFPLGAIRLQDAFRLLCGIDDGEIGTLEISKQELFDRLTSPAPPNIQWIVSSDAKSTRLPEGPTILTGEPGHVELHIPLARFLQTFLPFGGTYLDVGAQEGLFVVYLRDHFDHLVVAENRNPQWLHRNLATNQIENIEFHEAANIVENIDLVDLGNVTLIRLNSPSAHQIILAATAIISSSMPLILLHLCGTHEENNQCKDTLTQFGYAVEHYFPLLPQAILCTTKKHRDACPWLL